MGDLAVYVCINKKFIPLFKLFYESFRERANIQVPYDFFCYSNEHEVLLELNKAKRYSNVNFVFSEQTKMTNYSRFEDSFFYGMSLKAFALRDLMHSYKRVIYFDVDIMINKELQSLATLDLQGHKLAGVPDFAFHRRGDINSTHLDYELIQREKLLGDPKLYINSGMFVVEAGNTPWLDYDEFAHEWRPSYVDQDWLNYMFRDSILHIDEKWNYMTDMAFSEQISSEQRVLDCIAMSKAHVQHFHGDAKPWRPITTPGFKRYIVQMYTKRFYEVFDRLEMELNKSGARWLTDNITANRQLLSRSIALADGFDKYRK